MGKGKRYQWGGADVVVPGRSKGHGWSWCLGKGTSQSWDPDCWEEAVGPSPGTTRLVIWMGEKRKAKPPVKSSDKLLLRWHFQEQWALKKEHVPSPSALGQPLPLVYPILLEPNWEPPSKGETWFSVLVAASQQSRVWKVGSELRDTGACWQNQFFRYEWWVEPWKLVETG